MSLPLTPVVDVTYNLPAVGAPRQNFDLGLIMGESEVISAEDRVEVFTSLEEMADAGFSSTSPEYLAATLYFNATSNPSQVAIGRIASGETLLQAVTAARTANTEWYIVYSTVGTDQDFLDVAAYIEGLTQYSMFFVQSDDADVPADASNNLFEELKDFGYQRTLGLYSTSAHAVAGLMGYAMGQTSDFSNSAYTLFAKTIPGATASDLTTQQVSNIEGNNGNVYIDRGNFYTMVEKGQVFSGDWFDEIIYLDKFANSIQIAVMNLLYQSPKIPQTEDGMAQIRAVIAAVAQQMVAIGFLAPGKWTGTPVLTLNTNDYLPGGYMVMSDSIDNQESADRAARIAPPIYVAAKLAGAIQTVVVIIDVNR